MTVGSCQELRPADCQLTPATSFRTPDKTRTCMIRLEGGGVSHYTTSAFFNSHTLMFDHERATARVAPTSPHVGAGFTPALSQPNTVDRTGFEPVSTRRFKPPLYHWSYLSISPSLFQKSNLILLITSQAHRQVCLRGSSRFRCGNRMDRTSGILLNRQTLRH